MHNDLNRRCACSNLKRNYHIIALKKSCMAGRNIAKNIYTLANLYALLWWIRHTEAGFYARCGGYAIRRRGIMLTWWGIMLDVVDAPYRGGVLC